MFCSTHVFAPLAQNMSVLRQQQQQQRVVFLLLMMMTATIVLPSAAGASNDTVYLVFVNDVHNRLEEEEPLTATPCQPATQAAGKCVGGWPRISTQLKALRLQAQREGAGLFFLDAGDQFTGSLWDIVYKGQVTPLVQNQVKVDVMTIGNHEFDFGTQLLGSYIKNLSAPMLGACNVDATDEAALKGLLKKFIVLKYGNFKIGVLGWLTPDTAVTSLNIGKTKFMPITSSVTACLKELKQQHPDVDYIIGLSHAGYVSDLETAAAVPGLDVIIGGHSHTFLHTPTSAGPIVTYKPGVNSSNCVAMAACDKPAGPFPTYVSNVPVVQAYYSSKYMGVLKVSLQKRSLLSAQVILLGGSNSSNNVPQDPEILALLKRFEAPVQELKTQVVGHTLAPLEGDFSISRTNETNFGSYICDAFLRAVPASVERKTGNVTICLMNAGGIRSGLPKPGNVTVGQVLTMLPYANLYVIFTVTGQALLNAIRNGFTAYPSGGRFLQIAGLRVFHENGTFLSAVLLAPDGTVAIDPTKTYTIVSTDYLLQGGDGFNFTGAQVVLPAGDPYAQVVSRDMTSFLPDAINPTTHNRIINCAVHPSFPGCPTGRSINGKQEQRQQAQGRRLAGQFFGVASAARKLVSMQETSKAGTGSASPFTLVSIDGWRRMLSLAARHFF